MAKNESIESRTFRFSCEIVRWLKLAENDGTSQVILRQLLRSATSIGANVAEAQGCPSRKDFQLHLSHALKSSKETAYWLRLINETSRLKPGGLDCLKKEVDELSKILSSSIITLKEQ